MSVRVCAPDRQILNSQGEIGEIVRVCCLQAGRGQEHSQTLFTFLNEQFDTKGIREEGMEIVHRGNREGGMEGGLSTGT